MAICPKCIIGGVIQGGALMPADNQTELEFDFTPISDGEVEGERHVAFAGEIVERSGDGGFKAVGVVRGSFGLLPDDERAEEAVVESYTRDGEVVLVTLAVGEERDGLTFSANLRAVHTADAVGLTGVVFMGNLGERGTV